MVREVPPRARPPGRAQPSPEVALDCFLGDGHDLTGACGRRLAQNAGQVAAEHATNQSQGVARERQALTTVVTERAADPRVERTKGSRRPQLTHASTTGSEPSRAKSRKKNDAGMSVGRRTRHQG